MRIRHKPRLVIPELLLDIVMQHNKDKLKEIMRKYKSARTDALKKQYSQQADSLRLTLIPGLRGGREGFKVRLRKIGFTKYQVMNHAGRQWLCGLTPDYITKDGLWNMGPYMVCFRTHEPLKVHIIPERNKTETLYRHIHHYSKFENEKGRHPLDSKPHTCWGSFSAPMSGYISHGDIPAIVQLLYRVAMNHNPHSELVRQNMIPHKERT